MVIAVFVELDTLFYKYEALSGIPHKLSGCPNKVNSQSYQLSHGQVKIKKFYIPVVK